MCQRGIGEDPTAQPPRGCNFESVSHPFLVNTALSYPKARETPAGGWLTLQLNRDLIFILMPDQKGRHVVEFRDGLQGAVVGFA
jgi:hypothetical protein